MKEHADRLAGVESSQEDLLQRVHALENKTNFESQQDFHPGWVELKSFCNFEDKKTKGIDRPGASALVQMLVQSLPEDLKSHVKDFQLRGSKSYGVRVPSRPSSQERLLQFGGISSMRPRTS